MTEATRSQLIETGRQIFASQGLEGARVDRIAREAGVNKALINYHFRGKDGLYESVLGELLQRVADDLEAELEKPEGPTERLRAWPGALWAVLDRHPQFAPLFLRELLAGCDSLTGARLTDTGRSFRLLARTLGAGRDRGEIGRVEPFPLGLLLTGSLLLAWISEPLREVLQETPAAGELSGEGAAVAPLLTELIERGLLVDSARDPTER